MKTTTTAFTNFTKAMWWTIVVIAICMALSIFYLAGKGDTTALGDPYYEDQILAPERAFGPWALSLFGSALTGVLGVLTWWKKRSLSRRDSV